MAKTGVEVGVVKGIHRYPVKSMAGEFVEASKIGWHGVNADRRYAFLKLNSRRGFPWLTMRDHPELIQYSAYLVEPNDPLQSPVNVLTPDGDDLPIRSPELLAQLHALADCPLHLVQDWGGIFDAMDLSIISTNTVNQLSTQLSIDLEMRRFRPNIVVEIFDTRPFPEDRWLKELVVFGDRNDSVRLRINRKTLRCMAVNLDPFSAEQNPQVLKTIVQSKKNQLGVYASVEYPGTVEVGDVIRLIKD
jgi:uncharacterized protein